MFAEVIGETTQTSKSDTKGSKDKKTKTEK